MTEQIQQKDKMTIYYDLNSILQKISFAGLCKLSYKAWTIKAIFL